MNSFSDGRREAFALISERARRKQDHGIVSVVSGNRLSGSDLSTLKTPAPGFTDIVRQHKDNLIIRFLINEATDPPTIMMAHSSRSVHHDFMKAGGEELILAAEHHQTVTGFALIQLSRHSIHINDLSACNSSDKILAMLSQVFFGE